MISMWEKDERQICPEIHYRKTARGIEIVGCYGADGSVVLPDEIGGEAVTGIAAYAFAENQEEDGQALVWETEVSFSGSERKRISGNGVTEIWFPSGVTEIGRYAFYRCKNLEKLILTDSLPEIGGGAFTGCSLSAVEIYLYSGEQSCLKSILDEMRFAIRARLHYMSGNVEETVQLLFPEHYEEAVENTPARILFTQHHGAGGYYRQCFYDRKLDYKRYDELLFRAAAQEQPDIASELVLNRLRYPFRLEKKAREAYERYVGEHIEETAEYLVEREDIDGLVFLAAGDLWTEAVLDSMISKASKEKRTEILSLLMEEKHRRYPVRKRHFEL